MCVHVYSQNNNRQTHYTKLLVINLCGNLSFGWNKPQSGSKQKTNETPPHQLASLVLQLFIYKKIRKLNKREEPNHKQRKFLLQEAHQILLRIKQNTPHLFSGSAVHTTNSIYRRQMTCMVFCCKNPPANLSSDGFEPYGQRITIHHRESKSSTYHKHSKTSTVWRQ